MFKMDFKLLKEKDVFPILFPLFQEGISEIVLRKIATMSDEEIQAIRHKYGSKKLEET